MSDVELLTKMIEADPDNLVGERMLTDALVEERDMIPTEAAEHVRRVIQSARDARDLTDATKLLAIGQPRREYLLNLILLGCGLEDVSDATVFVTVGSAAPHLILLDSITPGRVAFSPWTLVVGATWLLRYQREHVSQWQPKKATPRRRRKA